MFLQSRKAHNHLHTVKVKEITTVIKSLHRYVTTENAALLLPVYFHIPHFLHLGLNVVSVVFFTLFPSHALKLFMKCKSTGHITS